MTHRANSFTDQRMSSLPILSNTSTSKQFESTLGKILQLFPTLLFLNWRSLRHGMVWRPHAIAQLFFFAYSKYFPRISSHNLLRFKTERLLSRETLPNQKTVHLLRRRFVIRTTFCIPQWYLSQVCVHVEYIPNIHYQEMTLVLQIRPASPNSSTQGSNSAFFQPLLSAT